MATEYGFIYVIGNPSMPNIFKIGFTLNHPLTRMEQLSGATACPTPFELLAAFGTPDPRVVETLIHQELADWRINTQREFFKTSPAHVLAVIEVYASRYFEMVNTVELERLCSIHDRESELDWKIKHFHAQSADVLFWRPQREGLR